MRVGPIAGFNGAYSLEGQRSSAAGSAHGRGLPDAGGHVPLPSHAKGHRFKTCRARQVADALRDRPHVDLLVAPKFFAGAKAEAEAAGTSWVDETGAASIHLDPLIIVCGRTPKSRHAEPSASPWTPATFAVDEALLTGTAGTVKAVSERTELAIGTAARALRQLHDEGLLEAGPRAAGTPGACGRREGGRPRAGLRRSADSSTLPLGGHRKHEPAGRQRTRHVVRRVAHHCGGTPEFVPRGGFVPDLLCSRSDETHAGTTDIDVQVDLEIPQGSVHTARLERALRNAEFEPDDARAWRWEIRASDAHAVVKFELLADQDDLPGSQPSHLPRTACAQGPL